MPAGEVYQAVESPRGRDGLLHRERRDCQAVSGAHGVYVLCEPANAAEDVQRTVAGGCGGGIGSIDIVLGEIDR